MTNTPRGMDLRPMLRLFWRGRFILAGAALLGMVAFGYHAFFVAAPQYRATAVVVLETRREPVADLTAVMTGLTGATIEINTELEVLRGRVLMGQVVDALTLIDDPEYNKALVPDGLRTRIKHRLRAFIIGDPPMMDAGAPPNQTRESVITALLAHVSVQAVPDSVVFRITATSGDPAKAALIADSVAQTYIAGQIAVKQIAIAEATDAYAARVAEIASELDIAEAALADHIAAHPVLAAGAVTKLDSDLTETRRLLAGAALRLDTQSARLTALKAAPNRLARASVADDDELRRALANLASLSGETGFDARFAGIVALAEAELTATAADHSALNVRQTELEAQLDDAGAALRHLEQLQREVDATRSIHAAFLTRLKETSAQQGMVQADSRILSDAVIPQYHSAPRRSQLVTMGLIFGLVGGTGLILLRDAMTSTFRNPRDLETATGLKVLGHVPAIPASGSAKMLQYLSDRPQSVAAEAVRNLRTSLMVAGDGVVPKVIVSTSALPDEGKSTVAMALAQNLAAIGTSVVLVDGDLRQSAFKTCFGVGTGQGLMAVLAGDVMPEDAIFAAEPYGFDVLAGSTETAPGIPDVLSSDRFADLVELLAETYDVVLIDAPPVLIVPDARSIGRLARLILFSVRSDVTKRAQVIEGLRLFEGVSSRPPALVLTRASKSAMRDHENGTFADRGATYYRN